MRDVVVTTYTPAMGGGRALRTYGVVAALVRHRPVDLVYQVFDGPEPAPEYRALEGVALHPVQPSRGAGRAVAVGRTLAGGAPLGVARAVAGETVDAVRSALAAAGGGRLIADGPGAAAAVLALARAHDAVYLAHNLESAFRGSPALRHFERRVLRTFGESWLPTAADVEGARAMAPGARLRHVRNVVDVAAIAPVRRRPDSRTVLLAADYTYPPNREGLEYLAGEVLPRLRTLEPRARLLLVGRGLDAAPPGEGIEYRGFVDDLGAAYAEAAAVAVPMLHGGGSPLKFVEGLARALPVVATVNAARLLEDGVAGEHFIAAADADAFAAGLAAALRGELDAVAAAGRRLVVERLSVEALVEAVAP